MKKPTKKVIFSFTHHNTCRSEEICLMTRSLETPQRRTTTMGLKEETTRTSTLKLSSLKVPLWP